MRGGGGRASAGKSLADLESKLDSYMSSKSTAPGRAGGPPRPDAAPAGAGGAACGARGVIRVGGGGGRRGDDGAASAGVCGGAAGVGRGRRGGRGGGLEAVVLLFEGLGRRICPTSKANSDRPTACALQDSLAGQPVLGRIPAFLPLS